MRYLYDPPCITLTKGMQLQTDFVTKTYCVLAADKITVLQKGRLIVTTLPQLILQEQLEEKLGIKIDKMTWSPGKQEK
jgi:hypothetical protein